MSENIQVESRGAILHIEIRRPEKKNALTVEMYAALGEALARAEAEDSVRVVMITGAGDAFTAGNDLRDFLERPPATDRSPTHVFLERLIRSTKPIVAAVHGLAVGIGTTLLLHCDLVYAGRGARFHLPFVHLGLVPEAGSSLALVQRAGYARAAELLLLSEPATADEALAMGIVSRVFDDDRVMEEAWARADRLASLPPESVRATKALMRRGSNRGLEEQMAEEFRLFGERLRSPEAREVMQKFFQNRK
jgi:enoyl-CoA hydratase/carnithine racemase